MREGPLSMFLAFMSGHNSNQMHLGDVARWYTLAMYWALLAHSDDCSR
jgi:hypothetical protein